MRKIPNWFLFIAFAAVCACSKKEAPPFSIDQAYGQFKGTVTETIRSTTGAVNANPYIMAIDISIGDHPGEIKILFERNQVKALITGRTFKIVDTTYPVGQTFFGFGEFVTDNKISINYSRSVPIGSLGYLSNIYIGTLEKK
jgi:hypothetical protein